MSTTTTSTIQTPANVAVLTCVLREIPIEATSCSARLTEFGMLTHVHGRPSASSGSQSVLSNESTPSASTSTSGDARQSPGTEDFDTQLDDYLLQDNFDDGTLCGRISNDLLSSSLHVTDLDAAYEARAKAKIEAFNADFYNAYE